MWRRRLFGFLLVVLTLALASTYAYALSTPIDAAANRPEAAVSAPAAAAPVQPPTAAVALPTVSPTPTPTPTPPPTPPPTPSVRPSHQPGAVPRIGTGRLATVPGGTKVFGSGPLKRFKVEVEIGIGQDPKAFAAAVDKTLSDPRSWAAHGRSSLQRVDSGVVAFRVVLASPRQTDRLCAPLRTASRFSCFQGDRSIINLWRWVNGAAGYEDDLASYRQYLVNHEVGHALIDNAHLRCPGKGELAPVMVPQTESLDGCRANPWPYP